MQEDRNVDLDTTYNFIILYCIIYCTNCTLNVQGAYKLSEDFTKPYFHKYWNTWCYYHLKEECLQFHSDLKCIQCAPHVWHGRCPDDTPIPAKPSQACLVWRSRLRCWCALAILVVSLEVVGRKHCPWRNPTGRNRTLSGLVTGVARCRCCLAPARPTRRPGRCSFRYSRNSLCQCGGAPSCW